MKSFANLCHCMEPDKRPSLRILHHGLRFASCVITHQCGWSDLKEAGMMLSPSGRLVSAARVRPYSKCWVQWATNQKPKTFCNSGQHQSTRVILILTITQQCGRSDLKQAGRSLSTSGRLMSAARVRPCNHCGAEPMVQALASGATCDRPCSML